MLSIDGWLSRVSPSRQYTPASERRTTKIIAFGNITTAVGLAGNIDNGKHVASTAINNFHLEIQSS